MCLLNAHYVPQTILNAEKIVALVIATIYWELPRH